MRPYQCAATNWMLDREKRPQYFPSEFVTITRRTAALNSCHLPTIYYNPRTAELRAEPPGDQLIPTGGILADEMGLGKTVELLALIDAHRAPGSIPSNNEPIEQRLQKCPQDQLWCVCGKSKQHRQSLVQCVQCQLFQHLHCISADGRVVHPYRCPVCSQSHFGDNPHEGVGTLIALPAAIKEQWVQEYRRHVIADKSSILVYPGVRDQWIDPRILSSFDVVITDFTALASEMYYLDANRRTSTGRNGRPRLMPKRSPLMMVKWWRVCVDEAQMVDAPVNRTAMLVKMLPAVHRWSITGTPMEKSIDNLFGLVRFLGASPYDDAYMWKWLTNQFRSGNVQALVDVLQRIMWRTCKASVLNSLGIPPQKFVTHFVQMTDLQEFFYNTQHAQSAELFRDKLYRMTDKERQRLVSQISANELKTIMEPMRKLRQDCVVPSAIVKFESVGNVSGRLKLLPPAKLHQYLLTNHEKSCKNELRSMVSSINGLAALHVINGDYELAIGQYKRVLELAHTYKGNISVDSLLQIHAYHNALDVYTLMGVQDTETQAIYAEKLNGLLDNYLRNCHDLIVKTGDKQSNTEHSIKQMLNELEPESSSWWMALLNEDLSEKEAQSLLDRISQPLSNGNAQESWKTITGLKLVLANWMDRVHSERSIVGVAFDGLDFFVRNIQKRGDFLPKEKQRMDIFVAEAKVCHLGPNQTDGSLNAMCEMCKIRRKLVNYECVLFDKQLENEEADEAVGTWHISFQETILRSLYNVHRNSVNPQAILLRWGKTHLAILDELKTEFKDFRNYWVELNYAVAALDELTMCKSRLQLTAEEVAGQLLTLTQQQDSAHRGFVRLQGILKYLRHIQGEIPEMDVCPICNMMPSARYAMLECGHHVCTLCLMQMRMYTTRNVDQIQCAICRNVQAPADVYLVSCAPSTADSNDEENLSVVATGDYSVKLIAIVSNVLQLLSQDSEVKVLIFSHWKSILSELLDALTENGVVALMKSRTFQESIDKFKCTTNKVTCLLLPLSRGSKGLNLIEATHVFLVEPILDSSEELQAIGRVHRIGQTKSTTVHRFILSKTIEETIHNTITNDSSGMWSSNRVTLENLEQLFNLVQSS